MKKLSVFLILPFLLIGCGSSTTESNSAPTASSVSITDDNGGSTLVGDVLSGSYSYADVEDDAEGSSIFRWLRDGAAISGATTASYTLVLADSGTVITFEVTPVAASGTTTGDAVTSNAITVLAKPLNDTGIATCGDYATTDSGTYATTGSGTHNNNLDCFIQATVPTQTTDGYEVAATGGDIIRAGQDALYGRDATNNDDSDGYAGFSFTKLDSSGDALANQTQDYATNAWACVKDNVTGLTWEVKTTSGLQISTATYTWYNSDSSNNGGNVGTGPSGSTEEYVTNVNVSNSSTGICGATDWRMPTKHELMSIVNNNTVNLAIDVNYFPNTVGSYWSSSPYAGVSVSAWSVNFNYGYVVGNDKDFSLYVRLVRGSQ